MDFTEWTSSEEGENQKVKAEKVIATIFWDACSIIHIDYLPSKQTINGDYYAALLDCFNNILKKKRPHLVKKKVLFYQDNARIHTCPARMAKFNEFRYELLPHSIFARFNSLQLFSVFKENWRNGSEERDSPLESSSSPKQRLILKSWINHVIRTVWKSWIKYIELKGDYVEK